MGRTAQQLSCELVHASVLYRDFGKARVMLQSRGSGAIIPLAEPAVFVRFWIDVPLVERQAANERLVDRFGPLVVVEQRLLQLRQCH